MANEIHKPPRSVATAHSLILLGALIWFLLAILLALNAHPAFPDDPMSRNVMAVLSVVAGCVSCSVALRASAALRISAFGCAGRVCCSHFFDDVGLWTSSFAITVSIAPA
jgi:hypothetical protein